MKTFKLFLLLFVVIISSHLSSTAQAFNRTWLQYFGEDSAATAISCNFIAVDSDNVYVLGIKDSVGFRNIMQIIKYDLNGNMMWEKYYTNSIGYINLSGILIDSNGDVIIGATEFTSWNNLDDYCIFKYNPSGTLLWKYTFNGLTSLTDRLVKIKVDSQNNIYASGESSLNNTFYQDVLTIKLNPSGTLSWYKYFSYPNDSLVSNYSQDINIDKANNIILTGNFNDSIFCKLDSAGNTIKVLNFAGLYNLSSPVAIDDSCNYYFADRTNTNYSLAKVDSSGNILFSKIFNPSSYSSIYSMRISGSYIFTTGCTYFSSPSSCITVKSDLNGDTVWTASFGSGNYRYYGAKVIPQSNGNVIVVCQLDSSSSHISTILLKYSAQGQLLSANDLSSSINYGIQNLDVADNEEGKLYCALRCILNGNISLYGVAGFDSTSVLNWTDIRSNFQNDSKDIGYKIIKTSSGNIIVAGQSVGSNGSETIVVLAYDPSGNLLWKRLIHGQKDYSFPLNITSDNQNNIMINGYQSDYRSGSRDLLFAKLDAFGNVKFINTNPPQSQAFAARSSFTDNFGNNFVGASSIDSAGRNMSVLLKYDSLGNFLWEKMIADTSNISGITYSQQDYFYCSLSTHGQSSNYGDICLIKADTSGNILWRKEFNGAMSMNDIPLGCLTDAVGNIILVGITDTTLGGGTIIQKYNDSGALMWETGLPSATPELNAVDFTLDVAGNIYLALEQDSAGSTNYVTVMLDSFGSTKWIQYYSLTGSNNLNKVSAITFDQGYVFVTGRVLSINHEWLINFLVYDTLGTLIYQDTIKSNCQLDDLNIGNDIMADGNGCVYITGLLDTYERRQEIATIKYCSLTAGQFELDKENNYISVFPNPSDGLINILSDINADVLLIDMTGKRVLTISLSAGRNLIDVQYLSPGFYFLKTEIGVAKILIY